LSFLIKMKVGMIVTCGGIIIVERTIEKRSSFILNCFLANA